MQRLTCAALIVWVAGALSAFSQTRQIVLLYDERTDLPGIAMLDAGFVRALTAGSPEHVEIYREAMDLSRFDSGAYRNLLRDHLRAKYAGKKIDVVVVGMQPALDFLLNHRDEVFPGVPIVFCGIDRGRLRGRPLPSDVTGVLLKREFSPTLEIALRLHPETDRIVVVAGTSEFDAHLLEQAREEFRPFEDRLAFTYLTALPLSELLSQLSRLPPKTIVLYSTVFRDGAGKPFVPHEVAERVSAAANVPVYGFHDQFLGRGIVGGRLYGMGLNGEAAAGLVLKILRGTKPSDLPLIEPANSVTAFDWRQLQRWNISEGRLPPGSTMRFREPTIWELYWKPITGTILFCLLQAALIVSLLINRARRRRGEAEAKLIADISSKFVNLPPGEVDREIGNAQRRIFELLDLDVSGFWQWSADALGFFRLTHYSRAGAGRQIPEGMNSQEYFPWYQQQVLAGRTIAVRSMTELPPEAARDRATFDQFGFKSNLTIPLSVGGEPPIGALGFTTRAERDWPDALVKRLQQVAQIFANALARKGADRALRESEERYREVVESQTDLVCRYRADTTLTFVNEAYCRYFGKQREDLIGSKFLELIPRAAWNTVLDDISTLIKADSVQTHEHEVMLSDGSIGWQQWVNHPIVEPDGTVAEYQAIGRDISDRKRAEEAGRQLAHTARVSTMGALAASLAHELNQPLTAILSNAQAGSRFLAEPSADVAEVCEVLRDIAQDTQRAGDVIHQLRKLVKNDDIQFEALDLNLLIPDVVRLLHTDTLVRKVQIALDFDGELPPVRGDRVQLQQVMFNLLLNAFDAMKDIPEGERTVCVRTRQPEVGGAIQIEVSDRGTGISPDRLARLFEPFQTTKQEGLGLGLSISRSIVEAHGGRLWATNNADRGATFYFTLPLLLAKPDKPDSE